MKKLLTLVLIVFFSAYVGNLYADPVPVEVFSSNFSISGNIQNVGTLPGDYQPPFSSSYSNSGPLPLSSSVSNGSGFFLTAAQSSANFFSVSAFAVASGNVQCLANASATAEWTFEPLSSMNQLTIYYDFGNSSSAGTSSGGNITLTDTTTGTTIFSTNLSQPSLGSSRTGWTGSDLINYSFQTNHVYDLALSTNVTSYYDGRTLTIGTNSISVPEPASLLLLGLGITGLAGVRRKFRN